MIWRTVHILGIHTTLDQLIILSPRLKMHPDTVILLLIMTAFHNLKADLDVLVQSATY